jgi:predicted O-methyltransferase YrrM
MIPPSPLVWLAGLLAAALLLFFDLRRRRLPLPAFRRLSMLAKLDLVAAPLAAGYAVSLAVLLFPVAAATGFLPLRSSALLGFVLCAVFTPVFWSEGKKQIQFQRPIGLLFAEWLFLMGAIPALSLLVSPRASGKLSALFAGYAAALLLSAVLLIAIIVPPFMKKYEGLRILERVGEDEQFVQPEYTPATPECPHPEMWHMLDSQSTEVEVLDLLKSLVVALKPQLIVETGTFLGHGTTRLAEGARENGFGKVITIEFDPAIRQRALSRFESMGLSSWIESRLESSLDTVIDGTIDFLFSDSHLANREAEIRRLLPQLDPRGVLVIHDASSHFKLVREAALRLEAEGLISTVLLSTPRGVVIAQRREGRE